MTSAFRIRARTLLALIASVILFGVQGCATQPVAPTAPIVRIEPAVVPGMPADVRFWGDDPAGAFRDWLELPEDELVACCAGLMDQSHNYLVLSSGGVDGAFGAGLLVGWTAEGTRPEFQLVTGVSAGAMIAPFAFLGPAYDGVLREIYSAYSSKDLVERRGMAEVMGGGAVMDTAPLRRLIDRYLGDEQIAEIASEGRKGRKLLIGTTSLNTGRSMVWDLTKMAASGSPNARQLIGDVILASASIPGVFPPVRFSVEHGGVRHDELHVDGGVTAQLFLAPAGLDWKRIVERLRIQGQPQVYLIRNARSYPQWTALRTRLAPLLDRPFSSLSRDPNGLPEWDEVEPGVSSILARSMESMLRTRGFNDAVRLYLSSQSDQLGFNLAHIPEDFSAGSKELYDRNYMQGLFERGFLMAKGGYPWLHSDAAGHE
ncbi:MAG: hypothetical protein RL261_1040 [Pseudomonadota bacterium]|jgi:predicted patatin/cPLA2 family phospholipase